MIVVNCRFLTQQVTGVQRYAEEILSELVELRDDLVLVAPDTELRRTEVSGVPVQRIGAHTGHRWEQQDLVRFVRAQPRGTLLLSLMNTGPIMLRNQIVTHHDVTYVRHPETYSRAFRIAYRALSMLTLRRALHVVTVSEFSKTEISDVYRIPRKKISVVPNAAGRQFSPAAPGSVDVAAPYFLAVGSVLPHKNLPLLVRAFLQFADATSSETALRIVGSKIRMSAEQEPIPDDPRVIWMGRVDDDELITLYQGARALVFPSLYEGFGIPPLEAQACGAPVISSNAASLPEILGGSALYFTEMTSTSLSRSLEEVDSSPEVRLALTRAGQENASRFSWTASALTLSALLDRASAGTLGSPWHPTRVTR